MNMRHLLKSAVAFCLVVFLTAGVIFEWPQIILNESVLRWLTRRLDQKRIHVDWGSLHLYFESQGLFKKRVSLDLGAVCIELPESKWSGCADRVSARFGVDFSGFKPRFTEITPLFVKNLKWELGEGLRRIRGEANLEGDEARQWSVNVRGRTHFLDQSILDAQGRIQLVRFSILHPKFNYHFDLNYRRHLLSGRALARIEGVVDRHRWTGRLDTQIDHWFVGLPKVSAQECSYFFGRKTTRELWHYKSLGEVKLFCPVRATLAPVPHDDLHGIPNQLLGTLSLRLAFSDYLPRLKTELEGEAQIVLDPIRSAILEGGGQMRVRLTHGVIGESVALWKMDSATELRAEVPEFQRLVEDFQKGPWAIPAPFHVLRGSISLRLEGEADWKTGSFPFRLSTHLHSSTQFIKLNGNGYVMVKDYLKRADWRLGIDATLIHAQLELPRLDWARPPKLLPDNRFYASWPPEKAGKKPNFHYRISLKTQLGHPAYVLTNLTQRKVPVFFQVLFSDSEPVSGLVRLASFPVEIFRRKAQIESLQLNFRDPLSSSLIFGSMQTTYADYRITIQLGATFERPQIQLLSEPALPESQIVSVLLFGRPLAELNSAESSTVGNTRAAIADQALGLASLYALAATPIQSLAYDPTTGVVSAKVRLGEGSSLSLGTNTKESNVLEFQQRLGSNFSLQAGVESSESSRGSASASLQWSRRY